MNEDDTGASRHQRWALLRFAVVGSLLAAPPAPGELLTALRALAATLWRHPVSGKEVRFGVSTIERWYYRARRERQDPVGVLGRKLRRDAGRQTALSAVLAAVLLAQYREHPRWSVQLHADNLAARVLADPALGRAPSYASVSRFLRARGLRKRRGGVAASPGVQRAEQRREEREVRRYEATARQRAVASGLPPRLACGAHHRRPMGGAAAARRARRPFAPVLPPAMVLGRDR